MDMLSGFLKYRPGANWRTNFRTLKNSQWRPWLDRERRCVLPAMACAEPDTDTSKGNMMRDGSSARTAALLPRRDLAAVDRQPRY